LVTHVKYIYDAGNHKKKNKKSLEMVILCQSIRHDVPRGFKLQRQGREDAKSRKRRRFITAHNKNTTAEIFTPPNISLVYPIGREV